MKKFNVKRDSALIKCMILILLISGGFGVSKAQQVTLDHEGKSYIVPTQYLDVNFPSTQINNNTLKDSTYQNYLEVHRFPLPEDGDYERKVELWVKNNRTFPQLLPTGNLHQDSLRYLAAVEMWKLKNPKILNQLVSRRNQTSFSDEDFDLLYKSFPRMEHSGDAELDKKIYEDAINEWIRLYSYEKYLLIEPIVKSNEPSENSGKEETK